MWGKSRTGRGVTVESKQDCGPSFETGQPWIFSMALRSCCVSRVPDLHITSTLAGRVVLHVIS